LHHLSNATASMACLHWWSWAKMDSKWTMTVDRTS
jgi:hypothetical protein